MGSTGARAGAAAAIGAFVGAGAWLHAQVKPDYLQGPIYEHLSLGACVAIGAGVAVVLIVATDAVGLDLPLLGPRWRRRRDLRAYVTERSALEGVAEEAARQRPASVEPAAGGDAPAWIAPERALRLQQRIGAAQIRLVLLFVGLLCLVAGLFVQLFFSGAAGALGSPRSGLLFFVAAMACDAAVFVMGPNAWRVIAAMAGAFTLYAARFALG